MLSLKVKPFVILSGNSGTGKTKLSQLFAKFLLIEQSNNTTLFWQEYSSIDENQNNFHIEEDYAVLKSKNKGKYLDIDEESLSHHIPINIFDEEVSAKLGDLSFSGKIYLYPKIYPRNGNFSKLSNSDVEVNIDLNVLKELFSEDFGKLNEEISFPYGSNEDVIRSKSFSLPTRIFTNNFPFKESVECNAFLDGIEYRVSFELSPNLYFDDDSVIDYLKENLGKELELIVNTSNIQKLLDEFKRSDIGFHSKFKDNLPSQSPIFKKDKDIEDIKYRDEKNYQIIPVGANWTENRHIVGYYNVITDEYQATPAYDLIKQADDNDEAHFLILDEMNLSHVERYFADFLSAIESGEKIPLYGEKDLEIPQNLFIIGTVNVDETTYMFSPKVLDRANVLEFDVYPAQRYMGKDFNLNDFSDNLDLEYLYDPLSDLDIRDMSIDDLMNQFDDEFKIILAEEIDKFQKILRDTGFEFGFRVINEIVRFMLVAWKYEGKPSDFSNWERYFDAQIKQKILPKLHGSQKVIEKSIIRLKGACLRESRVIKYPSSYEKLNEMLNILNKQRYVSFIN